MSIWTKIEAAPANTTCARRGRLFVRIPEPHFRAASVMSLVIRDLRLVDAVVAPPRPQLRAKVNVPEVRTVGIGLLGVPGDVAVLEEEVPARGLVLLKVTAVPRPRLAARL